MNIAWCSMIRIDGVCSNEYLNKVQAERAPVKLRLVATGPCELSVLGYKTISKHLHHPHYTPTLTIV